MAVYRGRIRIEVEHLTHAAHQGGRGGKQRRGDGQQQRLPVQRHGHGVVADASRERPVRDVLDGRQRPPGQEREHPVGAPGCLERKPQTQGRGTPGGPVPAQFARRSAKHPPQFVVAAAQAAVAGAQRHVRDRQVGVVEEPFCKREALHAGQALGRGAELPPEQPAQVPLAHPDRSGKCAYRVRVQESLLDGLERPGDGAATDGPGGLGLRALRPAAQAGPVARLQRGRRSREVAHVVLGRGARGTHGAAEDARGEHSDHEPPVEARVAREPGAAADVLGG